MAASDYCVLLGHNWTGIRLLLRSVEGLLGMGMLLLLGNGGVG